MTTRHQGLRREFDRHQDLRHEFDRLQSLAREVCSCVCGSPPSSPLQDKLWWIPKELAALTAIAVYHGASIALSAMVLRHPELDLAGLEDDLSGGKPFEDALVVARRLEPIAERVTQGLTFEEVRSIRCAERELEVSGGSTGVVVDASSIGDSTVPSSSVDPPLEK